MDRGKTWSLLGPDMAAAAISDLIIQEREMDLIASTHGRGIYKMNLRPIQEAFKGGSSQENILFEIPAARLPRINDSHGDPDYSTMEKVPITFYLTKDAEVNISVTDEKDKTRWSKTLRAHKGFNQVRWDLVTNKVDSQWPYFIHYFRFVKPGAYTLQVTGKHIKLEGKLEVIEYKSKES